MENRCSDVLFFFNFPPLKKRFYFFAPTAQLVNIIQQ